MIRVVISAAAGFAGTFAAAFTMFVLYATEPRRQPMSSKHEHAAIKRQQHLAHAASLKGKRKVVIVPPAPGLFQLVETRGGLAGRVVAVRVRAGRSTYTLRTAAGREVDVQLEDVKFVK